MYDAFAGLISQISDFMYSYLLIVMLLGVGLYFTFRSKFVQLRLLPESIRVVGEKTGDQHSVSAFEALMVSTASRVGTGNIAGVASAIAIGGYGAVFWMWLIAIVGGATAFVESTLAQIYKKKDPEGGSYGGPSYYIQAALKSRVLGVVFAIALIATYAGGFNMLASYNLISSFTSYDFYASAGTFTLGGKEYSVVAVVGGVILAILVAICVLGGGKRIVKVTGVLVPVMGVLYILMALVVMVMNLNMIPSVLGRIFSEAFDFGAMFGGAVGFGSSAIMQGIKRGLYSNEAGVGSAPNAAAAADVSHPVKQGLVQMLSVFIDTILVCTATAMMCLCTGIDIEGGLEGAPLVQASLATTFGAVGPVSYTHLRCGGAGLPLALSGRHNTDWRGWSRRSSPPLHRPHCAPDRCRRSRRSPDQSGRRGLVLPVGTGRFPRTALPGGAPGPPCRPASAPDRPCHKSPQG